MYGGLGKVVQCEPIDFVDLNKTELRFVWEQFIKTMTSICVAHLARRKHCQEIVETIQHAYCVFSDTFSVYELSSADKRAIENNLAVIKEIDSAFAALKAEDLKGHAFWMAGGKRRFSTGVSS